jgi:HCOMODA/2-hydroxy-3-carboxy-muconic semialdehyde decarboxylase
MHANTKESIGDLVVATRILVNEQVIDGFGHVSVRDPSRADRYFMTRDNFGWTDGEDYIIELDLDSNPCGSNISRPSLERLFMVKFIERGRMLMPLFIRTLQP